MDKINFNKFIWFTGNIYIYIYIYIFLWWFSSSWNEKKKKYVEKKYRKVAGLLPIFSLHWVTIQQFVL